MPKWARTVVKHGVVTCKSRTFSLWLARCSLSNVGDAGRHMSANVVSAKRTVLDRNCYELNVVLVRLFFFSGSKALQSLLESFIIQSLSGQSASLQSSMVKSLLS